jgi:hypothetical protein
MICLDGSMKSLFKRSQFDDFDVANKIVLLLSGENPTNLNIRNDTCQIKMQLPD